MDDASIVLDRTEASLSSGQPTPMGDFWKVVSAAKRDPALLERHGAQIASIDHLAFEHWRALIRVGMVPGTVLAVLVTVVGLAVVGAGYYVAAPWNGLAILAGTVVLLGTTHGLGHLVYGGLVRIRFNAWFVASVTNPQPGVKIEYLSYLQAPPHSRAWMHASGAIVTKVVPFLMLPAAFASDSPAWTWIALVVIGIVTILTDIIWSTKRSDWKRFRREMKLARELEGR